MSGVGNAQTRTEGKGTVDITMKVNGKEFALTLTDVLQIYKTSYPLADGTKLVEATMVAREH